MPPSKRVQSDDRSEYRKEVDARKEEVREGQSKAEAKHVRGRWLTDNNALRNPDVRRMERVQRSAPKRLAKAGLLKIEESHGIMETDDREVTDRVTQADILKAVDTQTQNKKFDLTLDKLGPYNIDFSRNGTHVVLAGLRGHLATFNWKDFSLQGETQLKDKCTDVKFLVDHSLMAVAQRRFVYMYTKEGEEVHILSKMANNDRLEYLPKHMILCGTSSTYSTLHFMDISTGKEIATKAPSIVKDPTVCLKANPANGVLSTCDLRGIVKFWSPTIEAPLVQLKAHKGAIADIAFHNNGRHFVTLGNDHKMKIWDTRTLRALDEYAITYNFNTVDISATGLVAMGGGTNVQVWKDMFTAAKPSGAYMKHGLGYGNIAQRVRFAPFEDILAIGHSRGFSTMIVPGSGEANPDFYFANPHETETHRKDRVVTSLLDKLSPDTISLDLKISGVDEAHMEAYNKRMEAQRRLKNIKARRGKLPDKSLGEKAPSGVAPGASIEDEVDEALGFELKGPARVMLSKKEVQKQKKMAKWDKKDSADKVRSKQNMRHSKIVKKLRGRAQRDERKKLKEKVADEKAKKTGVKTVRAASSSSATAASEEAKPKKSRTELVNAAFMRFKNDNADADDE